MVVGIYFAASFTQPSLGKYDQRNLLPSLLAGVIGAGSLPTAFLFIGSVLIRGTVRGIATAITGTIAAGSSLTPLSLTIISSCIGILGAVSIGFYYHEDAKQGFLEEYLILPLSDLIADKVC